MKPAFRVWRIDRQRVKSPITCTGILKNAYISLTRKPIKEKGHFEKWPKFLFLLVPTTGFELVTYRLQGGCSTN